MLQYAPIFRSSLQNALAIAQPFRSRSEYTIHSTPSTMENVEVCGEQEEEEEESSQSKRANLCARRKYMYTNIFLMIYIC